MTCKKPVGRGFTLVELLVVIGIIAILIGVLLPVLGRVQARGRDLKCQANIRQIMVALTGYAQENKGYYPYGWHWARTKNPFGPGTIDWDQRNVNDREYVSWASQITRWMNRGRPGIAENDVYNFSEVLRCPEAQQVWPHPCSYVMNLIVGVTPVYELDQAPPPNAQLRPANVSKMLKDTVLIWDTSCLQNSDNNVGYLVGLAIDDTRFWKGAANPHYRYFNQADPFAPIQFFGNNDPIYLNWGSSQFRNIDPNSDASTSDPFPYLGNLRFRHQGGTACNAGFADGHVEAFKAKFNSDGSVQKHNALRRYFMTKPPSGLRFPDLGF